MVSLPLQLVVLGAVLGAALAAAVFILISFVAFITTMELPVLYQHEEEKFFLNARGQKETLPSIRDSPTKQLSVVVPSYNEEKRLPVMMDEALGYLEERQKQDPTFTYEVIVVDDGSKDQTSKVAFKYCQKYGSDKVRVITLVKNRGKGGAVKMGVFSSRGEKILMADADGATKFRDIEKLEKGLNDLQPWPDQMAIACGSRAHLKKDSIAQPKTAMLCFWETEALTSHWHQDSCVTQSPGNELLLFLLPLHCPEQTASSCFLLIYCASAANGTVVFYVRSTQPIKY
ncbi:dolichyl-phosphate beta-glucosyltransferase isoform X3 [Rousettus aegyptiacus]|uniref:dolichyl-phosphate beta-glucosyltransferase isoform X3 n=1 Tax=Rousettus aegyptiacus TaxID=9407 RepID=UPI000786ABBF|nr:dolichyl-phosphate beta-glucosyltransferase isoform X3 [Rousettus aegyptiacus]